MTSLPAHLVGYTIAGARHRWRLSIRKIESVANARIARRSALRALRRLDCSVERMEASSNRRSLAFVWHTTLSDGTELSVKSIGWTKLAQWADPTKRSQLLMRLGPDARIRYEAEQLRALHAAGFGPMVWGSSGHVIVRDWIRGTPLLNVATRELGWMQALFETISQLHREGFYHGDLHVDNVLAGASGKVYLIDPSVRFKDEVPKRKRELFDYAMLLGSTIKGLDARPGVRKVVSAMMESLRVTERDTIYDEVTRFARRHAQENTYVQALASYRGLRLPD